MWLDLGVYITTSWDRCVSLPAEFFFLLHTISLVMIMLIKK